MKSVLVKFCPDNSGNWGFDEYLELRQWCYKNVKTPWCAYVLGLPDGSNVRHTVFEFDSQNEAMKFRLYRSK